MLFLLLAGWRSFGLAWGATLFALALMVLGAVCTSILRRLEMSMRRNADVIADVAAVGLARHPGSLADLCARLADLDDDVVSAGWRSELMWFEMVEAADLAGDKDPTAKVRTRRELFQRAIAADAAAGRDIPEAHRLGSSSGSRTTPPTLSPPDLSSGKKSVKSEWLRRWTVCPLAGRGVSQRIQLTGGRPRLALRTSTRAPWDRPSSSTDPWSRSAFPPLR